MKFDVNTKTAEVEEIGESFKNKKAKISEKNSPYIFSLLSNIYSKPVPSIVREITSNCFDAHIECGTPDEPVLIRLYADETAQLHVEFIDNGYGISPDKMDDIFMSYGESTKRDSDDFIGAFGLGSKSPFSYGPYFYVITKVDGLEYTYLLNTTVLGPEYDCLLTQPVLDGSSGTIIRVPIKASDLPEWKIAIREQLKYFRNVYLVNFEGLKNDHIIRHFNTFQVREDLFKANVHGTLHLSLGDVTYPIRFEDLGLQNIYFNVALKFKIGALDVTPNREEIKYTPKSKAAIINQLNAFKEEILAIINEPSNFIFDDLYTYYNALSDLDTNSQFKIFNFLDTPITLNLNNFNLITKDSVKLKLDLDGGDLISLNYKKLNPEKHTNLLFKTQWHNSGKRFSKVTSKSRNNGNFSLFMVNEATVSRYVFVDKPNINFKLSERRWLVDQHYTHILYFNFKEFKKMIVENIMKANDMPEKYSFAVQAIDIFYKLWPIFQKRMIYNSFNADFKSFVIPPKYGNEKRASIKKAVDTILYYEHNDYAFIRKENKESHFTNLKETIFLCDNKMKDTLGKFHSFFQGKITNLKFIYCAGKYHKALLTANPNFILLKDEIKVKEFFQIPKNLAIYEADLHQKIFNEKFQSLNYEFSQDDILQAINYLEKDKFLNDNFTSVLGKLSAQIFKFENTYVDLKFYNFYNMYLSKEQRQEIKKKLIEKIEPLFDKTKAYKKFEQEFFIEINFVIDYKDQLAKEQIFERLKFNIIAKKGKMNKYLKLI